MGSYLQNGDFISSPTHSRLIIKWFPLFFFYVVVLQMSSIVVEFCFVNEGGAHIASNTSDATHVREMLALGIGSKKRNKNGNIGGRNMDGRSILIIFFFSYRSFISVKSGNYYPYIACILLIIKWLSKIALSEFSRVVICYLE